MKIFTRGKAMTAAVIATVAIALPIATASTAAAGDRVDRDYIKWTASFLECQTLGNQLAQQGKIWGFQCLPVNGGVILIGK